MSRVRRRKRGTLSACMRPLFLATMVVLCAAAAFALDPSLDISQYAHASWKVRDGFTKGRITAIAQTPDGYLWLGTEFGLYRFDGVNNVPWQPPADQRLPSSVIFNLLVTRDGTLWIATDNGLASCDGHNLAQYPELAGQWVFALREDRDGTVWVGTASIGNAKVKLCTIRNGSVL